MSRNVKISLTLAALGIAAILLLLIFELQRGGTTDMRAKCRNAPQRQHWRRL